MALIDDIKAWYDDESYPPEGYEWPKTALVSQEDGDELRWGTSFTNVYQRGDEFVAVQDVRPATEMQDWGDYGEPTIFPVVPETEVVTRTIYKKVVA